VHVGISLVLARDRGSGESVRRRSRSAAGQGDLDGDRAQTTTTATVDNPKRRSAFCPRLLEIRSRGNTGRQLHRQQDTCESHSSRKRTKHGIKRKSHDILDLDKKRKKLKKRRSNNIYAFIPEDHGDHPQSVMLSFAQ